MAWRARRSSTIHILRDRSSRLTRRSCLRLSCRPHRFSGGPGMQHSQLPRHPGPCCPTEGHYRHATTRRRRFETSQAVRYAKDADQDRTSPPSIGRCFNPRWWAFELQGEVWASTWPVAPHAQGSGLTANYMSCVSTLRPQHPQARRRLASSVPPAILHVSGREMRPGVCESDADFHPLGDRWTWRASTEGFALQTCSMQRRSRQIKETDASRCSGTPHTGLWGPLTHATFHAPSS